MSKFQGNNVNSKITSLFQFRIHALPNLDTWLVSFPACANLLPEINSLHKSMHGGPDGNDVTWQCRFNCRKKLCSWTHPKSKVKGYVTISICRRMDFRFLYRKVSKLDLDRTGVDVFLETFLLRCVNANISIPLSFLPLKINPSGGVGVWVWHYNKTSALEVFPWDLPTFRQSCISKCALKWLFPFGKELKSFTFLLLWFSTYIHAYYMDLPFPYFNWISLVYLKNIFELYWITSAVAFVYIYFANYRYRRKLRFPTLRKCNIIAMFLFQWDTLTVVTYETTGPSPVSIMIPAKYLFHVNIL